MTKILIIEDELKIQQIIKVYLEKEGFEVIVASDGGEGITMIKSEKPDLIILDLMLPEIGGEEVLVRLRQTSEVPVIILSAKSSENERIFGLNIGADDYLVKPFSPRELVARVHARLRHSGKRDLKISNSSPMSFNQKELIVDNTRYEVSAHGKPVNLTPTEFKILNLLAQSPGQVFRRSQLVELIQGYHYDGLDRTIDSHVKNLRQKIETHPDKPLYIITVFGVGYKFGGVRDPEFSYS